MIRIMAILGSAASIGWYYYFLYKKLNSSKRYRDFFRTYTSLHPNWICAWRTMMAMIGTMLYFLIDSDLALVSGIFIFTAASYLDGVDGLVARTCDLKTEFGEWLDPFCDKISYSVPLLLFSYYELISLELLLVFIAVEFSGQFAVRQILRRYGMSVAANKYGKIKTVICFALVIYLILLHGGIFKQNLADLLLAFVIILSFLSAAAKFPFSFYARIWQEIPRIFRHYMG